MPFAGLASGDRMCPNDRAQRPDVNGRRAARPGGSCGAPLPDLAIHGAKVKMQAAGGEDDREGENKQRFHEKGSDLGKDVMVNPCFWANRFACAIYGTERSDLDRVSAHDQESEKGPKALKINEPATGGCLFGSWV
jgi:hypothetical protein